MPCVVVGDEDHVIGLVGQGVTEAAARIFRVVFAGEFAITGLVPGQRLGREPQSIDRAPRAVIPAGGWETTAV